MIDMVMNMILQKLLKSGSDPLAKAGGPGMGPTAQSSGTGPSMMGTLFKDVGKNVLKSFGNTPTAEDASIPIPQNQRLGMRRFF